MTAPRAVLGCALAALLGGAAAAEEILPGVHRLHGIGELRRDGDLAPLAEMLEGAEVVGLGEAVHTTAGFSRAKARLLRYMIEELGYRALGFESSWLPAEAAADYVATCEGTATEAVSSLFGVWQGEAIRDLLAWMCDFNRDHPDDPVHFYGFDIQAQTARSRALLRAFLGEIGIAVTDELSLALDVCAGDSAFVPPTAEQHRRCLDALDALWDLFDREEDRIVGQTSEEELAWARIHVVGLRAWEEEIFYIDSDFERGFAARDAGMAYVARAIRELRFPGAKTAIWAHNAHIARGRFVPGVKVMGVHLKQVFRKRYKTVGLIAYAGEVDWPGVGCGLIDVAEEGSVEELLHRLGSPYLLVDLKSPRPRDRFLEGRRKYDINWGFRVRPQRHFDALVYLERAKKMRPLDWPPCETAD